MFVGVGVDVMVGVRVCVGVGGGVNVAEPASNVKLSAKVPAVEPMNCAEIPASETVYFINPKRELVFNPIHLAK